MLLIPAEVRFALERWVGTAYPHEACGLLVGQERSGLTHVRRALQARNLVVGRARDRYELDPGDHLAADREARAQGLEIVGVWHSHPDQPALPSEADRAAAWEGWSYLILSVAAGGLEHLRSWRLRAGVFQEEAVASTAGLQHR